MATRTPQETLSDRKIAIALDDLLQDCLDAEKTANGLKSSKVMKTLSRATASRFDKSRDRVLRASDDSEVERERCLNGKSKDLKRMRKCLQVQVESLDDLQEYIGRLQVLEDCFNEAQWKQFFMCFAATQGDLGYFVLLKRRLEELRKKLEKAIKATRDVKIKTMVATASAAVGICLIPFAPAVVIVGGLTMVAADVVLDQVLNGNEDTTAKKTWDIASNGGAVADLFVKTPKNFGPALDIVSTGFDLGSCVSNERERTAIEKEIKALSKEFNTKLQKCAKRLKTFETISAKTRKDVNKAISSVRSLRPGKSPAHGLLRMI